MDAAQLGYWFGGFIFPMLIAWVFLRLAGRKPRHQAGTLQALAIAICAGWVALGALGGALNLGAALALAITVAWAMKQRSRADSSDAHRL